MKFFIFFALVALASANSLNYKFNGQSLVLNGKNVYSGLSSGGYGASSGGSYGASSGGFRSGGYRSGGYGSGSFGGSYGGARQVVLAQVAPVSQYGYAKQSNYAQQNYAQSSGPVYAAVQSSRNVQYLDGPSAQPAQPQTIIIGPSVQPLDFEFQSQSSPVTVRQSHIPGQANEPQSSSHTEEPDYLKQEIVKPIIHEVTEAIQPYRKVTQEVRPVEETITQLVTRGQQQQQASYVRPQQVQAVAYQPQYQTVQLQAVQPQYQTVTLQAQPAFQSGGYQSSGFQGLSGLTVAQPSLALTGSTSYTNEVASPDNY